MIRIKKYASSIWLRKFAFSNCVKISESFFVFRRQSLHLHIHLLNHHIDRSDCPIIFHQRIYQIEDFVEDASVVDDVGVIDVGVVVMEVVDLVVVVMEVVDVVVIVVVDVMVEVVVEV